MPSRMMMLILLGVLVLNVTADAATTPTANCQPFPAIFANGGGPSVAVACPAFSVPGGTLTGVQLSYSADYQFGGPSNTVQVTFAPGGPAGVTWSPASLPLSVTGVESSGQITTGSANATAGISAAAFSGPFNVNITSSVVAGNVATSSGAVTVVYTYDPPPAITLACPVNAGTVGTPYSSSLVAGGGVPPYTFSISAGSLPPGLTLNSSTGAITGTPTAAGPFSFTARVVDTTGTPAGTTTASCLITIGDTPTPPSGCSTAAAAVLFPQEGGAPENSFLIRYAANLDKGDSVINVTNTGFNGAPLGGPGFGSSIGNLCVNVYTFSPDEQLISCCSCLVTPNGLASFSVNNDLLKTTLTGVIPTSAVVKLVASAQETGVLAGGMLAWGTTIHGRPPAGAFGISETPFRRGTLSRSELASITGRCAAILGNGSGFGVCRSCRAGALGADKR
jgi:hypothetical protein